MSSATVHSQSNSRLGTASSRRVVNRSGQKSRQNQLSALVSKNRRGSTMGYDELGTETEVRSSRPAEVDLIDFCGTADIYNDNGWDTDLEDDPDAEVKVKSCDPSLEIYLEACKASSIIPASYFLRHLSDSKLDMRHHGMGTDGIKPLATALASNTYILELCLMDNWLDQEAGGFVCDMLKENCYITHLDLSENRLEVEFAEQFVGVVTNNNTLTHVNLAGNQFDDKAAVFLAEAIMSTSKLEYLNLSKNQFGEQAGVALGPAIAENSSLRFLDLSWNSFRRKGAVALIKGVQQNILIQVLNLSWNGLALEGAKALCDALKVNSTLEQLDISNNRFTAEAAVVFSKCLVVNEMLKVLKIGQNPMQSAGCYGICAAILRNPNSPIKQLDFSDILVNNDFIDLYENKVKPQFPDLVIRHGADSTPMRPKHHLHPAIKLCNFVERHNIRLTDLFQFADPERRMRVSKDQFLEGIKILGIKLTEQELEQVVCELDPNGTGDVNYNELILGRIDFDAKTKKPAMDDSTVDKMWIR